jgi:hypothetical protein
MPHEREGAGLLPLILAQEARRPGRTGPDGATGLTAGATLAWRKVPDAVYIVSILEEWTSIRTRYNVITADTAVVVPDLEALGLPLGAGMSYSWLVSAIGPFASLDDAAGSTTFFLPGDSSSGVSAARRFTTAP